MTHSPDFRLEQAGIERARIEDLRDKTAATIRDKTVGVDAEFSDDDHIRLEQAVSDEIFERVLEYGENPRTDSDVAEWFDRIESDFVAPESTSAHVGVGFVLGMLAGRDDVSDAVWRLSNAVLAKKYDR